MHILGMAVSLLVFLLEGLLILRGAVRKLFRQFPLFYTYIIYCVGSFVGLYMIYWLDPRIYPSAWWIYFLVTILAEFAVLVEISDQIFRPFPAIRNLGRALTLSISVGFGLVYILPAILWSARRSSALFNFALRASITKALILVVLFYAARHFGFRLGRNVGGLMLGFSIYVAMWIAIVGSAKAFGSAIFGPFLWVMAPVAAALCMLVWTVSLWEPAPIANVGATSTSAGRASQGVSLELIRFNDELSKLMQK